MLKMPIEELSNNRNIAVKKTTVVAALPKKSDAELRRSAISDVRRAPMLPNPSKKSTTGSSELSHKDSCLYSAEGIKASIRLESQASQARSRTMRLNRYLPVRVLSYSIFVCLLLAIGFVALQFAGLAELRYQAAMKERQLAALQHQRDELTIELAQMSSLSAIEKQATALGMVYPNNTQKLDLLNTTKLSMNTSAK